MAKNWFTITICAAFLVNVVFSWAPGCIPNEPTIPAIRPEKRTGVWYNYLYFGDHPPRVNDWLKSTKIGKGNLPGTSTPALLTNVEISWWTPDYKQCAGQFAQTYVTKDGREVMVVYNSDSPNPLSLTSYALYEDYYFMQIRYFCTAPDTKTGICGAPNFFINTRSRPDTMQPKELARVREIADEVLARYCLSSRDFKHEDWKKEWPACSARPPSCYVDLINGLAQQFGKA
ncbi:uncharacterized protein LOC129592685 isoform X2 [Paramacrobiotus metropolitanus]|uniref:uncharacterized protein LOC129592685 isoform X2 n=1 Tax=Paramacrobiotus metropolitanus TaxID=2943436 RepID=UPI002445FCB5|nr:uncharacterized protein LOC129592685 isoform X2 [Paramacrobiotus metropolitanus]